VPQEESKDQAQQPDDAEEQHQENPEDPEQVVADPGEEAFREFDLK